MFLELFVERPAGFALPDIPMFVTAFSSNHFEEGLAQLRNFREFIRPVYPDATLLVYDIGLTEQERYEVDYT